MKKLEFVNKVFHEDARELLAAILALHRSWKKRQRLAWRWCSCGQIA